MTEHPPLVLLPAHAAMLERAVAMTDEYFSRQLTEHEYALLVRAVLRRVQPKMIDYLPALSEELH